MSADLDSMARDAASAARRSVNTLAGVTPPRARPVYPRRLVLAGAALAVVGVAVRLGLGDDVTTVGTGPATPGSVAQRPPATPPPVPDLGIAAGGTELVTGKTSDGRTWAIYRSSRTNSLCLGVDLRISNMSGGVCEGGSAAESEDLYRPLFFNDTRAPYYVGGRVPTDVGAVTVVLTDGTRLGPHPVIPGDGGPYYAVEVPSGSPPASVIGQRADGTSVRYDR